MFIFDRLDNLEELDVNTNNLEVEIFCNEEKSYSIKAKGFFHN